MSVFFFVFPPILVNESFHLGAAVQEFGTSYLFTQNTIL